MNSFKHLIGWLSLVAGCAIHGSAFAASSGFSFDTTFTHQGRLRFDGRPANGLYDFEFRLYTNAQVGAPLGTTLSFPSVLASNGLYRVDLDFGDVFLGMPSYIETAVQSATNRIGFQTLAPRQPINAVPYALWAKRAGEVQHGITNFATAGTYSFTVPADVTQVHIEAWGAGGGGGGGARMCEDGLCDNYYGGGAGAGGYARGFINVTPLETYLIQVGAGGTGGSAHGNGANGAATYFRRAGGSNLFICEGGTGGHAAIFGDFEAVPGTGGNADPFAGLQRAGADGDSDQGGPGQPGTLRSLELEGSYEDRELIGYGRGGNGGFLGGETGRYGCIIIQW